MSGSFALSSNGRTQDSGSCYHGSSPCGAGSLSGVVLNNVTPEISVADSYYYQRKYYNLEDRKVNNPQKDIAEGKNV